jgi:hypothetical protein
VNPKRVRVGFAVQARRKNRNVDAAQALAVFHPSRRTLPCGRTLIPFRIDRPALVAGHLLI